MKFLNLFTFCFLTTLILDGGGATFAQKGKNKIGAYYFDGWSGTTFHITKDLEANYPDREPVWGWVTSTQNIVDEQIALAADAGLSFFSFCWYHRNGKTVEELPENRAISFYKSSKNVKKLEYCLLVANHGGFDVGPENWDKLTKIWLEEFKNPQYLKVDKKPLLIFFESASLLKNFGSGLAVSEAFEKLRKSAREAGLAGATIAVCAGSADGIAKAEEAGADVITGYNYHSVGFIGKDQAIPIDTLQAAEQRLWTKLGSSVKKPYIPVSTMGWDPRPWSNDKNKYQERPYFTGFSAKSAEASVRGLINWMNANPNRMTAERIGLLYAWNENGEGAWLTPGKTGLNPLDGLKAAFKKRSRGK
ncbi:glycoside hydrolase family 99-like domain-containing protein [Dyadobacter sp. CY323]|uniref:glycoside hydrolase family 99-like domain-containing protein n=1 Tax=Dyadobacter sp. CY323 TaxID=2907302 RepID=UPI001F24645C|nr:glycoside hydrolase family 99-like domain-containing protein [Dyadobacter sp. CY323]MCE6991180.1 glycoside hydrolase family 99-like domain-containing protein [Dyadobacter sp. CY323]